MFLAGQTVGAKAPGWMQIGTGTDLTGIGLGIGLGQTKVKLAWVQDRAIVTGQKNPVLKEFLDCKDGV